MGAFKRLGKLWVVAAIPMNLGQWVPIPLGSSEMPKVAQQNDQWTLTTQKTSGGYLYLLPDGQEPKGNQLGATWEWKVTQFPNTRPVVPFDKSNDDFAVRVGVLIDSRGKQMELPASLKKAIQEKAKAVTYIVLYGAVQAPESAGQCGVSPYHDKIIYCTRAATSDFTKISASPVEDAARVLKLEPDETKEMKAVGVWVFADSDNSKSSSEGTLRNITVQSPEGATGVRRDLGTKGFPPAVKVDGKPLVLNGSGMRTATFLNVKVYSGALYLEKKQKDPAVILADRSPKQLEMELFHAIDGKDMGKAWALSFKDACGGECKEDRLKNLTALNALMPDVKEGDRMTYTFRKDSVEVAVNGTSRGKVKGTDFDSFLLSTWLGKNPPTEELKKGMLGQETP